MNLENVAHEEAVATLKATHERVVLLVGKPDSALHMSDALGHSFTHRATIEKSSSPQPCELIYYFTSNIKIIVLIFS